MKKEINLLLQDLKNFHNDEEGDAIQLIAITALLLLTLGGGWMVLGPKVKASFTKAGGELDSINNTSY